MSAPDNPGMGFRLDPSDELPHAPDASPNWNESVYGNAFDPVHKVGGWLRIGNRINEKSAEVSVCLYLPDGRVACQFAKPTLTTHEVFSAGGLSYRVEAPLQKVTFDYDGKVYLLADPTLLRRPKDAFVPAHEVPCTLHWEQTSLTPVHGGEPLSLAQPTAYGRNFSLGHFNLHTKVQGHLAVGAEHFAFDGHGWRDHSWGPRYWQNLFAHRLFTANFGDDLGITVHKIEDPDGTVRRLGTIFSGVGAPYEDILDLDVTVDWADQVPTGASIRFRTATRRSALSVRVVTMAPLRNRRAFGDAIIESRIHEAFAEYSMEGRIGYGMFELVDLVREGRMAGYP
jgi:hypothetical protein